MKRILLILALVFSIFFSCSSDNEVKSSENVIKEFKVAGITAEIKNDINQIYILVPEDNYESLSIAEPQITISEKASLTGNWTVQNCTYTVTAENGEMRIYSVYIDIMRVEKKYGFEDWILSKGDLGYYIPSGPNSIWSSGNAGIRLALQLSEGLNADDPNNYPTKKTTSGVSGNAVLLETLEGPGNVFGRNVPLLSGNFFLGAFNAATAMTDELAATELGRSYPAKPKSIKGYYKYKEGTGKFMDKGVEAPSGEDVCTIRAEFYKSDDGVTLNVKNIDASDLVIATASLEDCSETEGEGFHEFEITFDNYKEEPDFEKHSYKLAITFAASRKGDSYTGKIGSKLTIDEVEITDY